MPAKRHWTPTEDRRIAASRYLRRSWDRIATDLSASRSAVIERARLLGVPRLPPIPPDPVEDARREPLAPGHPTAWAVLTENTLLEGAPFEPHHTFEDPDWED